MDAVKEYLTYNWGLILVLLAFVIMLKITVFLEKKTVIRMYFLNFAVFALSIIVFTEFYLMDLGIRDDVRNVLMAIRYSAVPFIIGFIIFTLAKKMRWYIFIPAAVFAILNIVSIFTGIVFSIDSATGDLIRGPLGYLPYIAVGLYSVALVSVLIWESSKQLSELIPIIFLAFVFASGLVFPFVIGDKYSRIFCTTIGIALFVYYVFLILQLTKKDALTGLFNRQAYYAYVKGNSKEITGYISIDMNGLKATNDNYGHLAGDEALVTLANCFKEAANSKHLVYRIGGDEFVIICKKTSEDELTELISKIKKNVSETKYSCSIGYSHSSSENKDIDEMIKESDQMMYSEKARFYLLTGKDRRNR